MGAEEQQLLEWYGPLQGSVLLVDDDSDDLRSACRSLRGMGG